MIENRVVINEECAGLIYELDRYVKDKNGNIPTKHDHCIDIWRYLNEAFGYQFKAYEDPSDPIVERGFRAARPQDDFELDHFFEPDGFD
jgi:hypothetical protein